MALLEAGESWLRTVRRASVAIDVQYSQGADIDLSVKATRAATMFEKDDGETIVRAAMVDWLIDRVDVELVEELRADSTWVTADSSEITADDTATTRVLPASSFEPQVGDRITVVYDHGTEVFQVAEGPSSGCWEWHGRDGGTFRIHSVRV